MTTTQAEDPAARAPGQTGTCLPHWLIDAGWWTVSSLDLCGPEWTLLVAGPAGEWRTAAGRAQRDTGLELAVHGLPAADCAAHAGLAEGQALLVRPDLHIAAGPDSGLTPARLCEVLELLMDARNAAVRAAAARV